MAPSHRCYRKNDSGCCKQGKNYPVYECSPPVTRRTRATLTVNVFENGEDLAGLSSCDGKFHSNNESIISLSTGWFNKGSRCRKNVTIYGNKRKVNAVVVDQCDSTQGCDAAHYFQPPCRNNIIDASEAVWKHCRCRKTSGASWRCSGLMALLE